MMMRAETERLPVEIRILPCAQRAGMVEVYGIYPVAYEAMPDPDAHDFPGVTFAEYKKSGLNVNKAPVTVDGEISLFGESSGGFWTPNNYVKLLMNP
jgi:hypothetical protein